MPSINTLRETETITLPITKAKVEMYKQFLTGDYRKSLMGQSVEVGNKPSVAYDSTFDLVLALVKSWDLTDQDGKALPVTKESIDLLPIEDFNNLAEYVGEAGEASMVSDSLKKNT